MERRAALHEAAVMFVMGFSFAAGGQDKIERAEYTDVSDGIQCDRWWGVRFARPCRGDGAFGTEPDAGASGNRRSPRCGGEARRMVSGHVTCAANWREDREARMLRGVGDSSAPSGQKTERDSFHGLRFARP
jgi:hypothetical protein